MWSTRKQRNTDMHVCTHINMDKLGMLSPVSLRGLQKGHLQCQRLDMYSEISLRNCTKPVHNSGYRMCYQCMAHLRHNTCLDRPWNIHSALTHTSNPSCRQNTQIHKINEMHIKWYMVEVLSRPYTLINIIQCSPTRGTLWINANVHSETATCMHGRGHLSYPDTQQTISIRFGRLMSPRVYLRSKDFQVVSLSHLYVIISL